MVWLALIRKPLRDARWSLTITALTFFGLTILTAWRIAAFQAQLADEGLEAAARPGGARFFLFLGGPAMDFSTLAMEVSWWNHPIVVLTIIGWGIARASAAVSGEIERGTLDLTLSRPISRFRYLMSQVLATTFVLVLLVAALVAGNLVAGLVFDLESPPGPFAFLRPAAMVLGLGLAVFGYTLPLSAADVVRVRPGLIGMGATLAGLVAMSLAPQFDGYDWLENFSVFKCYAPVTSAVDWTSDQAFNVGVLAAVFVVGVVLAFGIFLRRDLPSNAG